MVEPKPHHDIDLLYPADDLSAVDAFLTRADHAHTVREVVENRLPHKRAFDVHGDLVEVLLAYPAAPENGSDRCERHYESSFYNGLYRLAWPQDTFCHTLLLQDIPLRVISRAALAHYRACRPQVDVALAAWKQSEPSG